MTRGRLAGLAAVALLLLAAVGVRLAGEDDAPRSVAASQDARVAQLREAADLQPCPAALGRALPDVVLPCLGGGPDVALADGPPARPTLVNVWGTWCPPCVEEVPDLVRFAERARGTVDVVGVLTQDTLVNGLEFSRQFGVHYPSVVDDDGVVMRAFPPPLPPTTLFVDASGEVVFTKTGKFRDAAELDALVAEHLGVRVPVTS